MTVQSELSSSISPGPPWNTKKRDDDSDSSENRPAGSDQGESSQTADPLEWFVQKGEFWETRTQEIQMHMELRAGLYRQFLENIGREICAVENNLENLKRIPLHSISGIGTVKANTEKQLQELNAKVRNEEYTHWKDMFWLEKELRETQLRALFLSKMLEMLQGEHG